MSDEDRMCVCGHNIWYHEDWNFDIHECTASECKCHQFEDIEDSTSEDKSK